MANFNGKIDSALTAEVTAQISDDDAYAILEAGARVLTNSLQDTISARFSSISGSLHDSIGFKRGSSRNVLVYPQGAHPGNGRGIRNRKKKGKAKKTNAVVGYVLEFGSPRHEASFWMSDTTDDEDVAAAVTDAESEAYNAIMETKT